MGFMDICTKIFNGIGKACDYYAKHQKGIDAAFSAGEKIYNYYKEANEARYGNGMNPNANWDAYAREEYYTMKAMDLYASQGNDPRTMFTSGAFNLTNKADNAQYNQYYNNNMFS